jgi:hypothetical protein
METPVFSGVIQVTHCRVILLSPASATETLFKASGMENIKEKHSVFQWTVEGHIFYRRWLPIAEPPHLGASVTSSVGMVAHLARHNNTVGVMAGGQPSRLFVRQKSVRILCLCLMVK